MFARRSRVLLLVASFACMVADSPGVAFADPAAADEQTLTIQDSRLGTGPCGFAIQRDIEGTVAITPSVDDAGNLMLTIAPVDLRGSLTNPANGKSVDLNWIRQNGTAHFGAGGSSTEVALALTGYFFRGYDTARSDLAMALPADTAEMVAFEPGARSADPWTHICGLLA